MASLKDIRRRIGSVKNTQQITKAMKMVAASKLRRAQQAIFSARPFSEKLEGIANRVISEIRQSAEAFDPEKLASFLQNLHPLLQEVKAAVDPASLEVKKNRIAFFVVSSDRGLCGAYNGNLIKFAWKQYERLVADSQNEVVPLFIGKKAYESFARKGVKGQLFSDFWTGRLTTQKTDRFAKQLIDQFLSGEFSSVLACFTQFKSALSQEAMLKKILPLNVGGEATNENFASASPKPDANLPFIYEPGREQILASLLPMLVKTMLYRIMADSMASEYGARMTAMDSATRNAGDMISRLTLEANRVRQASITKELMEIVGGAEALKG